MYKVTVTLGQGIPTAQGIARPSIEHEKIKTLVYELEWIVLTTDNDTEIRYARLAVLSVQTDPFGSIIK